MPMYYASSLFQMHDANETIRKTAKEKRERPTKVEGKMFSGTAKPSLVTYTLFCMIKS